MDNINLKRKVTLKRKGDKPELAPEGEQSKKFILLSISALTFFTVVIWVFNRNNDDVVNDVTNTADVGTTQDSTTTDSGLTTTPTDNVTNSSNDPAVNIDNGGSVHPSANNNESGANKSEPTSGTSTTSGVTANTGGTTTNSSVNQDTIEEKAKQVIDGVYGNGLERKKALGGEYRAIQSKVNEIYRNRE